MFFVFVFSYFHYRKFKYNFLNYFFPILSFWLFYINLTWLYSYLTLFSAYKTLDNISFPLVGIFAAAFISSSILWLLEKIINKKKLNIAANLIFHVAFTFLSLCVPVISALFIISNNDGWFQFLIPLFIFIISASLLRGLLLYLNHFSDSLVKEKDVELSRLKEVNAQSELKLLQSHINPHFLYNALNSIAGLAHNSPDKTEKMALSLSNLFRYSINKKGQKMSTVKEEVLMVQNYLDIEKIRFGDRLKFTLQVDEALENEQIPMYILQPLVENAIKHGVSEIRGEGLIILEIKRELDNLLIRVSDNGPDFPSGLVSGHGLQTVYDLLRLSYGDKASLKWENTPVKHISILIAKD